MLLPTLLLIVSLVLLYFGAEWLVRGGASLALRFGLSPLLVGLTVVAFGTSAPELVVSLQAALRDQGAIAVGNVIGSNIFNVALILGFTALLRPVGVHTQLTKFDAPFLVAASVLFLWIFRDNRIDRWEAAVFLTLIIAYTAGSIAYARRPVAEPTMEWSPPTVPDLTRNSGVDLALILGGLLVLVAGSRMLVDNAVIIARTLGLSEAVIALTIIASGTSMPELATSLVAAWRGQPDIAIGNVVGSNIFNILGILGVSGLAAPLSGVGIQPMDTYVMLGTAVLLIPMLWTRRKISRLEGGVLVSLYVFYLAYLWPK